VKAKGGSAGVDGISIETIAANPRKHLYPVWNRLASGSFSPQDTGLAALLREVSQDGDGSGVSHTQPSAWKVGL
jgi:hypothetical protein